MDRLLAALRELVLLELMAERARREHSQGGENSDAWRDVLLEIDARREKHERTIALALPSKFFKWRIQSGYKTRK